jgi:hypothetical protein
MSDIKEEKETMHAIETSSQQRVEKFKYSKEEKYRVLKYIETKLKNPRRKQMMPVLIYIRNKEISDIREVIYVAHWFTSLRLLAYHVMTNQYFIDSSTNYKNDKYYCGYGFKTEWSIHNKDEDFFLMDDLLLQEVWEDYKNNDKILYLIFDKKDKADDVDESILEQFKHIRQLIDLSGDLNNFTVEVED